MFFGAKLRAVRLTRLTFIYPQAKIRSIIPTPVNQ
jgi:hypothetical protein